MLIIIYLVTYTAFLLMYQSNEIIFSIGANLFATLTPAISTIWLYKGFKHANQKDKMFWFYLLLSMFSYLVAMLWWNYYEVIVGIEAPFPSVADFFWVVMILFLLLSFLSILYKNRKNVSFVQVTYDALIILIVVTAISWEFILQPIIEYSLSYNILFLIVGISYPIGDLVLFFLLLCVFNTINFKMSSNVMRLLLIGVFAFLAADTLYLYLQSREIYYTGHLIDILWALGLLLIGFTSFYSQDLVIVANSGDHSTHTRSFLSFRLWLPNLGVILLFAFIIKSGNSFNTITVGCMISTLLIIIRQVHTLMQNHTLMTELENKVYQRTKQLNEKNQKLEESLEQIEYLANHDHLTGLPNRRFFEEQLSKAIEEENKNQKLALLFLDLDRFKSVNDTLGHKIGDMLLVQATKRIKLCVGDEGLICRQGGDEFLIFLKNTSSQEIAALSERLLISLRSVFQIENHELFISTSVGASLFPDHGKQLEVLTSKADVAMYAAKKNSGDHFMMYQPNMDKEAYSNLQLENDLRYAVERKEFSMVYQPLIDISDGKMVGVEALIRWNHPIRGPVSPQEFIQLSEENGLIIPLGQWILETACLQWKQWVENGYSPFTLAINISIIQFTHPNFLRDLKEIIRKTGMEPRYLELEITENIPFANNFASIILNDLKHLGVKISLDDFGTGYSSLQYLNTLSIDTLKIDRSFIKDLPFNRNNIAIVQTIMSMAQFLDLKVVAEGVETKEQLLFLEKNGCQIAQGYYFSRPLPKEEFERTFLMDSKWTGTYYIND
ncbi:EAL domain-containing protein [Halalkalibacter akibai]|nr:EAL domain-containing protein [Halalkalibacter akibai]